MGIFDIFKGKPKTGSAEGKIGIELPADFPVFKYHRNPLHTGAIVKSDRVCPACEKKRGYAFFSIVWTESDQEYEGLCPWCIHDGTAAKIFHGFAPYPVVSEDIEQNRIDELMSRTPEMDTYQDIIWPTHCGDFCEFLDYIRSWDDVKRRGIEKDIIKDLKENSDFSVSEVKKNLDPESCMIGYLFRCLHCGKHNLYIDLD